MYEDARCSSVHVGCLERHPSRCLHRSKGSRHSLAGPRGARRPRVQNTSTTCLPPRSQPRLTTHYVNCARLQNTAPNLAERNAVPAVPTSAGSPAPPTPTWMVDHQLRRRRHQDACSRRQLLPRRRRPVSARLLADHLQAAPASTHFTPRHLPDPRASIVNFESAPNFTMFFSNDSHRPVRLYDCSTSRTAQGAIHERVLRLLRRHARASLAHRCPRVRTNPSRGVSYSRTPFLKLPRSLLPSQEPHAGVFSNLAGLPSAGARNLKTWRLPGTIRSLDSATKHGLSRRDTVSPPTDISSR